MIFLTGAIIRRFCLAVVLCACFAALAACGPAPVLTNLTATYTNFPAKTLPPTDSPIHYPSDIPQPTNTPRPTETQEKLVELPKRFDEEGLKERIIADFLSRPEIQGKLLEIKSGIIEAAKSDLELVIESYNDHPYRYPGFGMGGFDEKQVYENDSRDYIVVGYTDIDVGHLPGWKDGDKLKTLYLMSPEEINILVPVVIGVNIDNNWSVIVKPFADQGDTEIIIDDRKRANIEANGGLDIFLDKKVVGRLVRASVILYFQESGIWNTERLWQLDDVTSARKIINTPGNYLQRFTENPGAYLGERIRTSGGRVGPHVITTLSNLVSELDHPADAGGLLLNEWSIKGWE